MLRHAARGVPWALVAVVAVLLAGLLALVRWRPWTLWPLEGVAVGLLAAAVGWCLDEPAAPVVDVAPRGIAWRTAARATGAAALLAAWATAVWWARDGLFGHPAHVLLQGAAAAVLAAAWTTWRRASGEATPGARWAIAIVPITTAWALVRPFDTALPVFPYADRGWAASGAGWIAAGVGAAAMLTLVLAHDGRPRQRR